MIPLSWMPLWAAKFVWLGVQIAALASALWIAGRAGGARDRLDRAISIGLAFTVFLPVWAGLLQGNIEGPLALLLTLALVAGEGTAVWPWPAVLSSRSFRDLPFRLSRPGPPGRLRLPDRRRRPHRPLDRPVAGGLVDFAVVLPNMLAGSAAYRNNLAPAGALVADPSLAPLAVLATPARLLFIGAAALLLGLSIWLARRKGGWPAALFAATVASTLAPAAIWYHYTVALLPFAFFAWSRASERARIGMLAGLAGFVFAVYWPIVVSIPAFGLFTACGLPPCGRRGKESNRRMARLNSRETSMDCRLATRPARPPDLLGDPESDRGAAAQLAPAVVALQRGVQVQQAGQRGVEFGQRPGPGLLGQLLGHIRVELEPPNELSGRRARGQQVGNVDQLLDPAMEVRDQERGRHILKTIGQVGGLHRRDASPRRRGRPRSIRARRRRRAP